MITPKMYKVPEENKFLTEILERGSKIFPLEDLEKVFSCIQCGTCYGACPSGRNTAYNVRTILRRCQLGLREEALNDDALWNCTTCYTCQERCPREVMSTDIIRLVRNIAFEEGYVKKPHLIVCRNFLEIGHAIPLGDAHKEKRSRLGLSPIPPTTLSHSKALDEINILSKETGFSEKVLILLGGKKNE